MFSKAKNTKQQANVGLGIAIAHYSSLMHTVSIPLNDSQDYDLIVEKADVLYRVQVKTSQCFRAGKFHIALSMHGGNRKRNIIGKLGTDFKYDILFVVTSDGARYEIPRSAVAHITREICLPAPLYAAFVLSRM